jgi:hypothetical protein
MINERIGKSLLRIGKGRISLDFRERDLYLHNTKIQKEVPIPVIRLEVYTSRISHLKVGTDQQSKGESRGT